MVMPAYNGEEVLARSLPPLAALAARGEIREILVVDDGSTDATARIASSFGARVVPSGGRLGPGGARNVGARHATGAILWFVDADVVVHDDAARVLSRAFERPEVVAVFGAYDDRPAAPNFLSQYKNLAHRHHHVRAAGEAETFWAGCGAVRAGAYAAVGGFDAGRYPQPSIEDIELGVRLRERGGVIVLDPALQGTHLKVWRLPGLLRTDVLMRAVPWTRLIRERPACASMNASWPERLRAAWAWGLAMSPVASIAGWVPPWTPLAGFAAAIAINTALWSEFARARGYAFALAAMAFHQFHYLYASAAFVACALGWSPAGAPGSSSSTSV